MTDRRVGKSTRRIADKGADVRVNNKRVKIVNCNGSPYEGKMGVIVGKKENVMKDGTKCDIFLVRLDSPINANYPVIGLPREAIESY